jgi:hypothetical protein
MSFCSCFDLFNIRIALFFYDPHLSFQAPTDKDAICGFVGDMRGSASALQRGSPGTHRRVEKDENVYFKI